MKTLIADDDALSRRVLESILDKMGHEVVTTRNGVEAWESLQSEDGPPMAILDWMMPGMNGVEICHQLRRGPRSGAVYVILLTARGGKKDVVQGLDAGADDYLVKPFDRNELIARVRVGIRVIELQSVLASRVRGLEEALSQIRTLQGILTVCSHCHSIMNDQKAWQRMESYIEQHSEAEFSHGICPECRRKLYPELPLDGPA